MHLTIQRISDKKRKDSARYTTLKELVALKDGEARSIHLKMLAERAREVMGRRYSCNKCCGKGFKSVNLDNGVPDICSCVITAITEYGVSVHG